jgi:lipopolysaccharide biosynthesis regulator YciM
MDFDLQWLLLGLPIAFGLGWLASRLDLRQWRREQRDSPKAWHQGLNLLLNEQYDKAIDTFIGVVQQDPDTSELHFALGNLFRRRGEYERAVRVHEHLLARADLKKADRDRAQHELAQDFMKAGLFDRAEQAYQALAGTSFDSEARLALLALHERARDWRAALEIATALEKSGTASFATRRAHHWCELAQEAEVRRDEAEADAALALARDAAPQAARPLVLSVQRARRRGDHAAVIRWGETLLASHPAAFNLVARDYAESAVEAGQAPMAVARLQAAYRATPSTDLLAGLAIADPDRQHQRARATEHLRLHPSLGGAQALLATTVDEPLDDGQRAALREAITQAARPLQRYRCVACAFEGPHHFWQCPGCLGWDTYPPQRVEELG